MRMTEKLLLQLRMGEDDSNRTAGIYNLTRRHLNTERIIISLLDPVSTLREHLSRGKVGNAAFWAASAAADCRGACINRGSRMPQGDQRLCPLLTKSIHRKIVKTVAAFVFSHARQAKGPFFSIPAAAVQDL